MVGFSFLGFGIDGVVTWGGRVGFVDPTPLEMRLLEVPGKAYEPPSRAEPVRRGLLAREPVAFA
jgi:hypothetical protein